MRYDGPTQAYVERRTAEGLSKKDIIRCLKRTIAREIHRILTTSGELAVATAISTPTPA